MGCDMVVYNMRHPGIPCVDGLSMGPPGFLALQLGIRA